MRGVVTNVCVYIVAHFHRTIRKLANCGLFLINRAKEQSLKYRSVIANISKAAELVPIQAYNSTYWLLAKSKLHSIYSDVNELNWLLL